MTSPNIATLTIGCLLLSTLPAQGPAIDWQDMDREGPGGRRIVGRYGHLAVPSEHGDEGAPEIELAVARLPCTGSSPGAPILYLHGGPGGTATGTVDWAIWPVLQEVAEVILVDQRGCSRSRPSLTLRREQPLPEDLFLDVDSMAACLREMSQSKIDELRAADLDPSAFNTAETVADLEWLRRALGVPQWNLLGFSYGSHLGLAYLRAHPDAVAGAALIGVEGPNHTIKPPSTLDTHWRRLVALYRQDPEVGDQGEALDGLLEEVLAQLEAEPARVSVRDPVTGQARTILVGPYGLQLLLLMDLGDSSDIPVLPRLVYEVALGETEMLRWFVQKRLRMFAGFPGVLFPCDGASGSSRERDLRIAGEGSWSLFGTAMALSFPGLEELWQPRDLGDAYRRPVVSSVRTLFVSGALDSNTPPFQAEQVRWGFANSVHLIADHAGHEGSWIGNVATERVLHDFFAGVDVDGRDIDREPLRFAPLSGAAALSHPALSSR